MSKWRLDSRDFGRMLAGGLDGTVGATAAGAGAGAGSGVGVGAGVGTVGTLAGAETSVLEAVTFFLVFLLLLFFPIVNSCFTRESKSRDLVECVCVQ